MSPPTVRPSTPGAVNVLLGWLGVALPPPPRQRNRTRAAFRKTQAKRPRSNRKRELA